jgi:hypothetical protein
VQGTVTVCAEHDSRRTFAQLAGVAVVAELHRQLDDAPDADGDEAHAADTRHDLLQVGHVVRALQDSGVQLTTALSDCWQTLAGEVPS